MHADMYIPGTLPLRRVAMANLFGTLPLFCLLFSLLTSLSNAESCRSQSIPRKGCSSQSFSNNQMFSSCMDLPDLSSSIHWNYDPSRNSVRMGYRRNEVPPSTWISWAINPTSKGMVGSQALVAFQGSSGSMNVYPSPITSYKTQLEPGNLNFTVSELAAVKESADMIIFATVQLPGNTTKVNQVWQEGPVVENHPGVHDLSGDNLQSFGIIDFSSRNGNAPAPSRRSWQRRSWVDLLVSKKAHGVVNAISWGSLQLVEALAARHLKAYSNTGPAWFKPHVYCQGTAYALGVYGYASGFKPGNRSVGIQHIGHNVLGAAILIFGTIQFCSMFIKPSPDHHLRALWNKFHLCLGCAVIIMAIVNVFLGFNILKPEKKWEIIYIVVVAALCLIGVALEFIRMYLKPRANQRPQA